jgi:hypothetical protein
MSLMALEREAEDVAVLGGATSAEHRKEENSPGSMRFAFKKFIFGPICKAR